MRLRPLNSQSEGQLLFLACRATLTMPLVQEIVCAGVDGAVVDGAQPATEPSFSESGVRRKAQEMERVQVIQKIEDSRVIVILRHACEQFVEEHLPVLMESGLAVIEVSLTADNYAGCFGKLVKRYGDQLVIGTGTVFSREQAQRALDNGASFLISPHFNERLAEFIIGNGIPYIAGCLTPTEVAGAVEAGVDAVKIFPAYLGGPRYIAALRAPFPDVRFVPTGGVAPGDAPAYWQAGAWAVAIGSEMGALMRQPDAAATLKQLFSHERHDQTSN